MLVRSSSAAVETLKNFRLFALRKQRAGLRVMLQKQGMAVECEYYSEDPSARCMLAPNWALEEHLPGLTEICLISLAHWQRINRTDLKRFLVSYCTWLYNICRLDLSGEVKCRCKNLAQFWKVWTFFENVSFIFWYAIDFPSSRAAEQFPPSSKETLPLAQVSFSCENSSLIRFKDKTVLATLVCFLWVQVLCSGARRRSLKAAYK